MKLNSVEWWCTHAQNEIAHGRPIRNTLLDLVCQVREEQRQADAEIANGWGASHVAHAILTQQEQPHAQPHDD